MGVGIGGVVAVGINVSFPYNALNGLVYLGVTVVVVEPTVGTGADDDGGGGGGDTRTLFPIVFGCCGSCVRESTLDAVVNKPPFVPNNGTLYALGECCVRGVADWLTRN